MDGERFDALTRAPAAPGGTRRANVLRKLKLGSRTAAAAHAIRHGLDEPACRSPRKEDRPTDIRRRPPAARTHRPCVPDRGTRPTTARRPARPRRSHVIDRLLLPGALALVLSFGGPAAAHQDEAAPADATFADTLGLPELAVTGVDGGFEGVPAEIEAGRYLVTFTNESSEPEEGGEPTGPTAAGFVRLPEGQTLADLMPEGMASPEAEGAAEEDVDPAALAWLYDTYVAAGAFAEPGRTGQGIVDLPPGEYVVWADDPASLAFAPTMSVTGEMPADLPAPEADVTVTEVGTAEGYAFELTGEFGTGTQVVAVLNKSDQPHFLELARLPAPVTEEQLMQFFMLDETATPPPGLPEINFDEIVLAGYAPSQSAGSTQWTVVNVEPGTHWLACWVPDPRAEGTPHAMEGMIDVLDIGEA